MKEILSLGIMENLQDITLSEISQEQISNIPLSDIQVESTKVELREAARMAVANCHDGVRWGCVCIGYKVSLKQY
jgi:hypothetical protein